MLINGKRNTYLNTACEYNQSGYGHVSGLGCSDDMETDNLWFHPHPMIETFYLLYCLFCDCFSLYDDCLHNIHNLL